MSNSFLKVARFGWVLAIAVYKAEKGYRFQPLNTHQVFVPIPQAIRDTRQCPKKNRDAVVMKQKKFVAVIGAYIKIGLSQII
ncbi:MAG: hypothetical protein IPN94_09205 [Sphingobacteriales bacterium]|nr:hypothetical protein [Sphingobacteriales bacterium]